MSAGSEATTLSSHDLQSSDMGMVKKQPLGTCVYSLRTLRPCVKSPTRYEAGKLDEGRKVVVKALPCCVFLQEFPRSAATAAKSQNPKVPSHCFGSEAPLMAARR